MFHKFIVVDDACMVDAIHALANIHIDKTFVVDNVLQVLRIDNFLGYDADVYLHLFWLRNIVVEIKGFYIFNEELRAGRIDDDVKDTFGCGYCSSWGREGDIVI